jgi:hypothetical protein
MTYSQMIVGVAGDAVESPLASSATAALYNGLRPHSSLGQCYGATTASNDSGGMQ